MKRKQDVLQGTLALMVLKTLDVLGALTHDVPRKLEPPPAEWKPTFEALTGECGLKTNPSDGFAAVQGFVAGIGER